MKSSVLAEVVIFDLIEGLQGKWFIFSTLSWHRIVFYWLCSGLLFCQKSVIEIMLNLQTLCYSKNAVAYLMVQNTNTKKVWSNAGYLPCHIVYRLVFHFLCFLCIAFSLSHLHHPQSLLLFISPFSLYFFFHHQLPYHVCLALWSAPNFLNLKRNSHFLNLNYNLKWNNQPQVSLPHFCFYKERVACHVKQATLILSKAWIHITDPIVFFFFFLVLFCFALLFFSLLCFAFCFLSTQMKNLRKQHNSNIISVWHLQNEKFYGLLSKVFEGFIVKMHFAKCIFIISTKCIFIISTKCIFIISTESILVNW